MRGFRDVLVALDFSPGSARVLATATRVIEDGGRLHLLHVVEWIPGMVEGTLVGYANPTHLRAMHLASERQLFAFAATCTGVQTSTEVVEGHPARSILEVAERRGADLIVLGAFGHPQVVRMRIGAVADRVLRRATCPVLTVRP